MKHLLKYLAKQFQPTDVEGLNFILKDSLTGKFHRSLLLQHPKVSGTLFLAVN